MIRVYDFRCPENHITERFVSTDVEETECPTCEAKAKRIISGGNFTLDATSGDFPSATDKWAKHHEKAAKGNH